MAWLPLAALVGGCQHRPKSPAAVYDALATAQGLHSDTVVTESFRHRLYWNAAARDPRQVARWGLVGYLEHDGQPWLRRGQPSADPTPRGPIALAWLIRSSQPGVLLGRPGYHGTGDPRDQPLHPWHWTHGRYSAAVVTSLQRVVGQLSPLTGLIGHSGGGQLALLLAAALVAADSTTGLRRVATTAANFDHRAWTAHFGYSPLGDSLAAVDLPPLPATVQQCHWIGGQDRHVLPAMTTVLARTQPGAQWGVMATFDHHRDWATLEPTRLFSFN